MRKKELVTALQLKLRGEIRNRSGRITIKFLIWYLRQLDFSKRPFVDDNLIAHLPQILADAFDVFRNSNEPEVAAMRDEYEKVCEREVPNLTVLNEGSETNRVIEVQNLSFLFREITQRDSVQQEIISYLNAQQEAIQTVFDIFIRRVYRRGLTDVINAEENIRGMKGTFGQTELRSYVMAGRLMFTFARPIEDKHGEWDVSFVAEDGDPYGYSSGIQSIHAPLVVCLQMIQDVIDNWPEDFETQQQVFQVAEGVMLDAVAMMRASE